LKIIPFAPTELLHLISERGYLHLAIWIAFRIRHYDANSAYPIALLRARHHRPRSRPT